MTYGNVIEEICIVNLETASSLGIAVAIVII